MNCWINFKTSFHHQRSNIHSGVLTIVLLLYSYLKIEATITNDWDAGTKYCFAQVGKCMTRSNEYDVAKYFPNTTMTSEFLPLCYYVSDEDDPYCYSSDAYLDCTSDKWISQGYVDIAASYYSKPPMMMFDVAIISLSILAIIITTLFSGDESCFVRQDPNFPNSHNRKMILLSLILTFIQVALMITSSRLFSLMKVVSCNMFNVSSENNHTSESIDFTKSYEHDGFNLCNDCNSNIRSIIFPDNSIMNEYPTYALTFAIVLALSSIYNLVYMLRHTPRIGFSTDRSSHYNSSNRHDSYETLRYLAYLAATRFSDGYAMELARSRSRNDQSESVSDVYHNHSAFMCANKNKMKLWKFGIEACGIDLASLSTSKASEECAICIEPIIANVSQHTKTFTTSETMPTASSSDVPINVQYSEDNHVAVSTSRHARVQPIDEPVIDEIEPLSCVGITTDLTRSTGRPSLHANDLQKMSPVQVPCGHLFHERCICAWMRANSTCPICRTDLETGASYESSSVISNDINV